MRLGWDIMSQINLGVLRGKRVLVVEDEPLVSMALVDELELAEAMVVGPAASLEAALDLIENSPVDAAILDVELQQKLIYPAADLLSARGVPFILTTGHDAEVLPKKYAEVPCSGKPAPVIEVLQLLAGRLGA
jgi:DNA-binding NarL/FixJ family response regulator